jgi:peroxiredoxin
MTRRRHQIRANERRRDIRLKDLKGKKVVLYFYPKDNTSG